jgi:hypothetical protein
MFKFVQLMQQISMKILNNLSAYVYEAFKERDSHIRCQSDIILCQVIFVFVMYSYVCMWICMYIIMHEKHYIA